MKLKFFAESLRPLRLLCELCVKSPSYLFFVTHAITTPIKNPPICAHHATPPVVAIPNPLIPATNCNTNQYPKIKIAGTGIRKIKKNVNIR